MLIADIPSVPAQETPIVLAQAATSGTTPQPDYLLNVCQETESTGNPRSADRAVDPAYMLKNFIQNRDNRDVELASIKTTLLEGTTHAELLSSTSNYGRTTYHYNPIHNYVGNDQATFMAEFEGKRYKIVVVLHVFEIVFENDPTATSCPPPELIKIKNKPVSGSTGYGSGYSLGSLSDSYQPNPPFERDCAKARSPSTLR